MRQHPSRIFKSCICLLVDGYFYNRYLSYFNVGTKEEEEIKLGLEKDFKQMMMVYKLPLQDLIKRQQNMIELLSNPFNSFGSSLGL